MRRRIMGAILAGTLTLAAATTVRAGCCDDFWGCAGAVFTGGASCKIQQIVELTANLNKLIAAVDQIKANVAKSSNDTVAGSKDAVENMRADVEKKSNQAMKRMGDADQKLQLLINPNAMAQAPVAAVRGGSTVAAAPAAVMNQAAAAAPAGPQAAAAPAVGPAGPRPSGIGAGAGLASQAVVAVEVPADPARLKDALVRAAAIVRQGKDDATTRQVPAIKTSGDRASLGCGQKEPEARQVSNTNLIVPLDAVRETLLRALAAIANPFDFSDISKMINDRIAEINAKAPSTYDTMAEKMMMGARQPLDDAGQRSDKLDDQSQMAQKISELSEKAQQSKTKSALDKLEAMIGKPTPNAALATLSMANRAAPVTNALASARATTAVRPISQAAASRVSTSATALAKDWNALVPQLGAPPVVMSAQATSQRFDSEFAKKFQGKSREEAEQTKSQLLTEARSRFAKDPKTLEAFEKYLNEKSAPIIQSAAAARAPSRPSPGGASFAPAAR